MRAHTSLRNAFRVGMMMAVATGATFAASSAHADVASSGGPNSSVGSAALKYDLTKGLDTTIDTGYRGFSGGGVTAQVRAVVKIDPVKDGGPLFSVEMPKGAMVQASWGTDKRIVLKAQNGTATDGTAKVRHTLTPSLGVKLGAFGINAEINYDATKILQKLQEQGNANAKFSYDSGLKQQQFMPWGFTVVDTKVAMPDLTQGTLFTLDIDKLPEFVANNFDGLLGVRAVTDPTFSYKTTKIAIANTEGVINGQAGEVSMAAVDGDYLETMVSVEGELLVKGEMKIQPFIQLTKVPVLGNATINIPITAYSKKYDTTIAAAGPDNLLNTADDVKIPAQQVAFQAVNVHIPLPNVHAPSRGVDLGAVKAGGSASKTVSIENSGEMAATMTFKSSDPAFEVEGGSVTIPPKGTHELKVKFSSNTEGPASTTITVMSNDPDSPEQTFKVGANGADVGAEEASGDVKAEADSGCGCKTAGSSSSQVPGWAGLGLLGLGAVLVSRRRKSA